MTESQRLAMSFARRNELMLVGVLLATLFVAATLQTIATSVLAAVMVGAGTDSKFQAMLVMIAFNMVMLVAIPAFLQWVVPPWFERRMLAKLVSGAEFPSEVGAYEYARVSPRSVVYPTLLGYPIGILCVVNKEVAGAFAFLGIFLLLFAFAYHRIPNSRRSIKYAAFFTGSVAFGNALLFGGKNPADFTWIIWLLSPIATLIVFLALRARIRPEEELSVQDPSALRALSWHRWAMSVGPGPGIATLVWTLLRNIPFVGDFFFAARIWSKQRLARRPVLVLRSFSNSETPKLMANAVAPALSPSTVLVALVHPSQTAAALNNKTHEAWMPMTFGQTNERWRDWFVWHLKSAMAVVVDASLMSESTLWELQTSAAILGRERVGVLVPAGKPHEFHGLVVFEYTHAQYTQLKFALGRWIDAVVHASLTSASQG